ncbi:zinc-dependent alcohol dehydrogenase family protein [Rhodanobacter sp. L36]|uniref:zinc-dependent alcohol dehydrogenase family protein n=1 Tax=Rhodanobacter sp. L36 TaxID=1747221 RepID=UPI00131B0A74|nr:zinc-dependent alcohol dehydrogenase family protein [Rhodanobacter sp. L36]
MTTHRTMQAAIVDHIDGPFSLVELPVPVPADGQVLVRIHASGVNPLDLKIRAGNAAHAKQLLPAVLGIDMAGIVVAIGSGVIEFAMGDEVFGMTGGVGGVQGSLAEFAAVDASLLARKPAALGMREAAALPLAFITAWEGLVDRAHVSKDMRVLIHGGAGSVGYLAIQIARAFGAQVFTTVSAADAALVLACGAVAIDRHLESPEDYLQTHTHGDGFDIVVDTVGGEVLDASFKSVARFGHVVSALGWGTHALAPLSFRGGSYSGVFTLLPLLTGIGKEHHGDILREAARLVDAGKLYPRVDPERFDLSTVAAAHERVGNSRSDGKVVVDLVQQKSRVGHF